MMTESDEREKKSWKGKIQKKNSTRTILVREIRFVLFYFSFYHLHTDRIPFASIPAADGTGSDACACVHRRARDLIMDLAMLAGRHSITCGNLEMPHLADR